MTSPLHVFDTLLRMLDKKRGLLLISTQLNKATMNSGQLINSWYAAPRNGHISLYSIETMNYLAGKFKLDYRRVSRGLHIFSCGLNAKDVGKKLFFSKVFSRLYSLLR